MAGVAHLVERQFVALEVTGSKPVARPSFLSSFSSFSFAEYNHVLHV